MPGRFEIVVGTDERTRPNPLTGGLIAAALGFLLPVALGLITGNMSGRDFAATVGLSLAAFAVTYVVLARGNARR